MSKFSLTNLFGMTIRESANDGSDFTNPDADYRRLFLGEDGFLHVKDSAGAVTAPYDTSGGAVSSGTSFPGSPSSGDLFIRSDIYGWLFRYDGTRWRTVNSFTQEFAMQDAAVNAGMNNGSINAGRARVPFQGTYTLYLQRFQISFTTSGTNNGSNYSTFKLNYGDSADSDTQVGSTISTAALSANTVYDLSDTVDAVLSTNARWLKCRKDNGAGTPGNGIFVTAGIFYQIVAT